MRDDLSFRFEILARSTVVGRSDLEAGDAPMGVAGGKFVALPADAWIQRASVAARESSQAHIGLAVRLEDGDVLSPPVPRLLW